ncbi:MAG: MBL fold metallo-hydrolase [Elainella sp. Prado103]|nr:MBL fold metallo-hydrolase [Elainella sp. Prado103]
MRVSSLGHTGLKVESQNCTILVNPWLSPEGAFLASWFQYPDNQHLVVPDLFEPDVIIISQGQLDHLDPWFLAQIPSHVPAIIPKYPSPMLYQKVATAGERMILEKAPWEIFQIKEIQIFFVAAASPMHHDAAIVIISEGQVLVDLDEVQLTPCQLHHIQNQLHRSIDLLMLQSPKTPWFPLCYDCSPDRHHYYTQQVRMAQFQHIARVIKLVQPKITIPFASSPCFLDPRLTKFNLEMIDGIFPEPQQIVDWLKTQEIHNITVLLPGESWDLETQMQTTCSIWDEFSCCDRLHYLESYAKQRAIHIERVMLRYPEPDRSLWQPFQEYFYYLLSLSTYFNQNINMKVGFEITGAGGGQWAVDFRSASQRVLSDMEEADYVYRFSSRWLTALLNGTLLWEDFFPSLRFQVWHRLEADNAYLLGLLRFAHPEALQAVETHERVLGL